MVRCSCDYIFRFQVSGVRCEVSGFRKVGRVRTFALFVKRVDCLKEHRRARRVIAHCEVINPQSAAYVPIADSPFTKGP